MARKPKSDVSLKLLVLGAPGTGKTRFIERYCRSSFHSTEIGDVTIKTMKIKGIRFTISFWDTSSKQLIPPPGNTSPTSFVARGSHGAIVLYDITNAKSLDDVVPDVEQFVSTTGSETKLVLVGNKSDLAVESRAVSIKDAGEFARHHKMVGVLEVSAKKNRGFEQVMDLLLDSIYRDMNTKSTEMSVKVERTYDPDLDSHGVRSRSKCTCTL